MNKDELNAKIYDVLESQQFADFYAEEFCEHLYGGDDSPTQNGMLDRIGQVFQPMMLYLEATLSDCVADRSHVFDWRDPNCRNCMDWWQGASAERCAEHCPYVKKK